MGLLSPSADPPEGGRSPAPPGPILPSPDPFRPAGVGFVVSFPAQVRPLCSFRSGFLSVTPENGDIGFPYVAPTSGGGGGRDIRYPVGYRTLGVIRNRGTPFLYPLMAPPPSFLLQNIRVPIPFQYAKVTEDFVSTKKLNPV